MSDKTPVTTSARVLAITALVCFAAAAVVLIQASGVLGLWLLVVGALSATLLVVGGYYVLTCRGVARVVGLVLMVAALVGTVALFVGRESLITAVLVIVLVLAGGTAARAALRKPDFRWMPETAVSPPSRPYLVMNPRSGGGKVGKFDMVAKAKALGADVALLDGPDEIDVGELARQAVRDGADLLGVAGGDGTQALVAAVAVEHDLPFVVLPAGTRNHLAMDLGLDRNDPSTALAALTDAVEIRIDMGYLGDERRPFVNTASFGAYAEIVQNPEYRDRKGSTILTMLPDLLQDKEVQPQVSVRRGNRWVVLHHRQVVLVSNNPYSGVGRRDRLDRGVLGVVAGAIGGPADAIRLPWQWLLGRRTAPVQTVVTQQVRVDSDRDEMPVGLDGEAIMLPAPVVCTIEPRALRIRLPKDRPGVPPPPPVIRWRRLWNLALGRTP
ncbi:diacylglycerol kinase [Nakamurella flava]|uniref:Diacylglycerol kinase n=1 Tax=Nakamurella flava TaxID=2576308 RepID=A0A4U6QBH8_9ACTN|nr:diacylglycerol kinase family protein [Nakamurella flava]TKV57373.1 diacylglycerol kinase [Nakamurella flava]